MFADLAAGWKALASAYRERLRIASLTARPSLGEHPFDGKTAVARLTIADNPGLGDRTREAGI
jgi:hypothetical protein